MKIAVIGMGKIGLPLATQFASKGHTVVGVDVNPKTVELINSATEPFPGEAHLQEKMSELVPAGLLSATTDYSQAIPGADAVVIVVPLFVDENAVPDFGWMDQATESLDAGPPRPRDTDDGTDGDDALALGLGVGLGGAALVAVAVVLGVVFGTQTSSDTQPMLTVVAF